MINSAVLSVRKVRLGDAVMMQHTHALARVGRNAMYPYQHKVVCPYNITKGLQFFVQEKLFNGRLPKLVILSMVSSEAYVGAYTKNPFNFQHFGISYVGLKKDGENVPFQPFEPDFANSRYLREYLNIFSACGMIGRDDCLSFDYADYGNGYSFFVFNLTPDISMTSSAMQFEEQSNLRVELKFGAALTENVTLLVMGIFDGMVEIDANRSVYSTEI